MKTIAGQPRNTLKRIKLTEEDFADIRNIQPFPADQRPSAAILARNSKAKRRWTASLLCRVD